MASMRELCTTTISFHLRRVIVGVETFSEGYGSAVVCRLVTSAVRFGHRGVLGPCSLSGSPRNSVNGLEHPVASNNCVNPLKSCRLSVEAFCLLSSEDFARLCAVETPDGSQGKDTVDTIVSPLAVESDESPRSRLGCCKNSAHLRVTALPGTPGDANGVGSRQQRGSSLQNSVR